MAKMRLLLETEAGERFYVARITDVPAENWEAFNIEDVHDRAEILMNVRKAWAVVTTRGNADKGVAASVGALVK